MTAARNSKPFFHAEQVGSLLRPPHLMEARTQWKAGRISRQDLRAIEDKAIREATEMQEAIGLHVIVDGEFRRENWWIDFIEQLEGIRIAEPDAVAGFKNAADAKPDYLPKNVETIGRIGRRAAICADEFRMLQTATSRTPKITLPSLSRIHYHGGRKAVSLKAYPDMEEFWSDIACVYQGEIADLEAAGCNYIQVDDPVMAYFVDEKLNENVRAMGEDPDKMLDTYVRILNQCVANRRAGTTIGFHLCRGNAKSSWVGSGSYDKLAETVFSSLDIDNFFLEYDDERSGYFSALRFIPKGKKVVLGLVTTKFPQIEKKDDLKRRIEDASRFVPMEDLALSPQCGFASVVEGNKITFADQEAKLRLVVDVARDMWGSA